MDGGRHHSGSRARHFSVALRLALLALAIISAGVLLTELSGTSSASSASTGLTGPAGQAPPEQATAQTKGQPQVSAPSGGATTQPLPPKAPNVVLYDQLNNTGGPAYTSQQFGDAPAFTSQLADDFVVPLGQTWQVTEVDVNGGYYNGVGPATSFNVYFYTSAVSGTYTVPGAPVYTATAQSFSVPVSPTFLITLGVPPSLGPGTYYVSAQAVLNLSPGGQWGWRDRTVQSNGVSGWRNPGGGFGSACTNWDRRTFCLGDVAAPDQVFRLVGNVLGGPTATPTACGLPVPGTWTPVASLPSVRARLGLAFFPGDGMFYAFGGETTGGATSQAITQYNPATNIWTPRVNLIQAVENTGAAAVGNYIYIPGGSAGGTVYSIVQRYNPVANTIATVAPMPTIIAAHAVTALGTKVYVLGGSSTGAEGTTNYIYNTATNTWSSGAPLLIPVQYAAATTDGTYVYLLGGRTGATTNLTAVQRYDPVANSWTAMTTLNTARGGPGAFFDGGRLWVVGGGWTGYLTSTEYSTDQGATWTGGPSLNTGRRTLAAAFGNNIAMAAGGWTGSYSAVAEKLPFTSAPCPSPTACPIQFSDVPIGSTFYTFIRCLACRSIISGYPDGTFKPNNDVTRGQLSKIVSNSAGFGEPAGAQQFEDVPPGSTFYDYIWRLADRGYISGYPCGSVPSEPCVPPDNRPYFRTNNNATRGQISKIVSNAAGFNEPVTGQTFEDVPPGSTFYDFIERLASRDVMGGYPCGSVPTEPCIPPDNRPYFRPNNNATRGQTSKIVANTFYPACETPNRR